MTEAAITNNIKRILSFFKEERMPDINEGTPAGLLKLYGYILDYNGAPRSGLSLLYLTGLDYSEMESFCMAHCNDFMRSEKSFRFTYDCYNWAVVNK